MNGIKQSVQRAIIRQFGCPRGWLGALTGGLMARQNLQRSQLAVDLLDVRPGDQILEIGFGPGVAIAMMARLTTHGHVCGIDHSAVMVRQASRRNSAAIQDGRVSLYQAPASALPLESEQFTKALAINVFHHWQDRAASLAETGRVLQPGGLFLLVEQPRGDRLEHGPEALAEELRSALRGEAFQNVRTQLHRIGAAPILAASGRKGLPARL